MGQTISIIHMVLHNAPRQILKKFQQALQVGMEPEAKNGSALWRGGIVGTLYDYES